MFEGGLQKEGKAHQTKVGKVQCDYQVPTQNENVKRLKMRKK